MSCRRVRKVILEYVFDELEGDVRAWLESHLDGCTDCRRRVRGLRRLWRTLPEPYVGSLVPGSDTWEQSWNAIMTRLSERPRPEPALVRAAWPSPLRWATMAAALGTAFVLGRYWDDILHHAERRLGFEAMEPAGHFTGLDTFQSASGDYLSRSRLLLLELQLSNALNHGLDDPWLVGHSRNLLGQVPRLRAVARRIDNPQLEVLLGELEIVLNQILEINGSGEVSLPPGFRADLNRLLFKLEMLERPGGEVRVAVMPSAS